MNEVEREEAGREKTGVLKKDYFLDLNKGTSVKVTSWSVFKCLHAEKPHNQCE